MPGLVDRPGSRDRCWTGSTFTWGCLRCPTPSWGCTRRASPARPFGAGLESARERKRERFRSAAGVHANAHVGSREVRRHCRQTPEVAGILRAAVERLGPSARSCHRVLKLARTIADLAGSEEIEPAHVRESIQYRVLEPALDTIVTRADPPG